MYRTTRESGPANRFRKGRSYLSNLSTFCDKAIHLLGGGKTVDVIYLDFSKAFETVYHGVLLKKLASHGLDSGSLGLKTVLMLDPESGGEWSYIQLATGHQWRFPGLSIGASSV